jgi:ribonuclease D
MGRPGPGRRRPTGPRETALNALAEEHKLPVENLLEPALLRRVAWELPPGDLADALAEGGARPWQVGLAAPVLAAAFAAA